MDLNSLRDVFHEQLKDMYSAEKQLVDALPAMVKAASSPQLQQAFEQHLDVTKSQLETVRQLLDDMNVNPGSTKCEAMEGLVKEAEDMASKDGDKDARDAGLICAAQKVEHYEIATYGSLRTWARVLGEDGAADTLQMLLDQEYDADNTLDKIAEGYLNQKATS